jgi:excisionase family DNA binding protein
MDNVVQLDPLTRRRRPPGRVAETADVLSVAETARVLGLSVNTTYAYLADGTIPGRRVGRRWIVSRARLDAWLAGSEDGR